MLSTRSVVSANPLDPNKLATNSERGIFVYDSRNLAKRLFSIEKHDKEVTKVKWSCHNPEVIASSSKDRTVSIINLADVDQQRGGNDFLSTSRCELVFFFKKVSA